MASSTEDIESNSKEASAIEVEQAPAANDKRDVNRVLTDEEKKLLRRATMKTDWRLIPILGACYAISGIDRVNISAARIAGMNRELGFNVGDRYSIALLVFFVTYFIFEIPSNVVLRKVGAANWLSFLCFAWGLAVFGAGFAKKWEDIVVCRLLLGLFEAGFFPGCVYLISCWYTRFEVQKRLAAFYSISGIASGFGGPLAYGCMQLNGRNGWLGWRWIFIINGAMTIFLALLGRLLIVDFPDKVYKARYPFLKPIEIQAIQDKLERDRSDSEFDEINMAKLMRALARWELWVFAMKFFAVTAISYALAFFLPIILQSMGYSTGKVFLLSAPPAVAAIPWVLLCSWAADKWKLRAPFIVLQALISIVGLMIVAYAKNNDVRYFGMFMGTAGAGGNIPTVLAWQANNIRGQSLRMVASGLQVAFGAIGGIYASTVFMEREIPTYRTGIWAVTGAQFYLVVSTCALVFYYWRQNKKAGRGEIVIEGLEGFRYTY
ncbi:hypothetical protein HBI21_054000 [Parastagonospora nodorum]|nr:hypothetical protein HBH72_107550 [Parastagonospora nodorum]KAH5193609.1 hypothetical protein HBH76_064780 [Parastagonospora nodorum]KAH5681345.1 hypothetical protein HBI21_054000 [Parastagonospora nodorum]